MKFFFHPEARDELQAAVDYYEQNQTGLGLEFAEEAYATIARIIQYPQAWSAMSQNSRRCLVNRFPYAIIYQTKADVIRIIAVTHLHRHPRYWNKRLGKDPAKKQ